MSDSKTIQLAAQMILAADGEKDAALKKFTGVAYSGGEIRQSWNPDPVYIDLASMKFRPQVPLMVDHWYNVDARVGECQAEVVDGRLEISGVIDASTERGRDLAERGAKIPWQLSVGAAPGKATYLKKGEST